MHLPEEVQAATEHFQAGHTCEAEALCRRVLERDPHDPAATHLLGLMAHAQGRHRVALELLRRAVAAAPGAPDYRNNYATVLGQPTEMIEFLMLAEDSP